MTRIPTLDGWRGVAILLVLFNHLQGAFLGRPSRLTALAGIGLHGVTLFFVLSGFLITTLLIEEQQRTGGINLKSFYARRFFRLMPVAWTYLAVLTLLVTVFGINHAPWRWHFIGCVFFFRNFQDLHAIDALTQHFWSLSIEEQFYLIWPCTLLRLGNRNAKWLALTVTALIAGWRTMHWAALMAGPFNTTFATQYRADALLIGCVLALTLPQLAPYLRPWMAAPLTAVLVWYVARSERLVPLGECVIIALLLAVTSKFPGSPLSEALQWRPLAGLGIASYSIYIWQEIFVRSISPNKILQLIIATFVLVAWSAISYFGIECRAIAFGKRGRKYLVSDAIDANSACKRAA